MTLTGGKPIGYDKPVLLGGYTGAVVSTIAVSSSAKTASLSVVPSCGYIFLGFFAGAFCCVTSTVIHNKLCVNPQESTDNQVNIPLIANDPHPPATQVITQQPREATPLPTPPVQRYIAYLPETESDLPPPYSDVVHYPPPPAYSEVIGQRGISAI